VIKNSQNLFLWLWLCISVSLSFSSQAVDCDTDTIGLCTPTIEEIIEQSITETIEYESGGYTITTTTTTDTTTTTVTNEDSGDLLDGDNGYVVSSKEGDMDIDWGGQGPATMPSGSGCGQLGTDKCAEITGSGNSTSTMGVEGMGTTYIQTVDISNLSFDKGGRTNYSIKVDKQDSSDSIYMHITGKNGQTNVFSGTDILSASGTDSGYQSYEGGWDFSGSLTTVIIEIGGRDINLSIGPLFDDVTVNVLYNVVNTIITQSITSVEMFIALNIDAPEDVIDVVEDIFDSNEMNEDFVLEPIQIDEVDYDAVVVEIEEIEMAEIQIEVMEMEIEVEAELELEIEETVEETIEVTEDIKEEAPQETEAKEEVKEEESESQTEVTANKEEKPQEEKQEKKEETEKPKEVAKKESSKEKAVKKIMKKIDDKKRYDDVSQTKTLVVMQVLGNTKTFFESQQALNDRVDFFSDLSLPDTVISDNNMASYLLFAGSDGLMNEMIDSQWQN
jgi:hypothetical protein